MNVGWPAALFALAVLLVPIAIHLLQRGAGREVPVASIRLFTVDEQPSWRRLQLSEYALLALRLLLFGLLVALLARVAVERGAADSSARADTAWVVSGVDPALAASLAPAGSALRWLAPGLEPVGDGAGRAGLTEWSLLAYVGAAAGGDALTVIGPARPATLGPRRPGLQPAPVWIEAPADAREAPRSAARDVTFLGADTGGELADAVRAAVETWRGAGLPFGQFRTVGDAAALRAAARAGDWVIAAAAAPAPARAVAAAVVAVGDGGAAVVSVAGEGGPADASRRDLGFAARLFFELTGELAGPPPGYRVNPASLAAGAAAAPAAAARAGGVAADTDRAARWLILALAALWTLERMLSAVSRRGVES